MLNIIKNETLKIFWNRSAWVSLVGGSLFSVFVLWMGYKSLAEGEQFPVLLATVQMSKIAGLLFVVLAGTWLAQEFNWRTLALLLSRGIQRVQWLLGRLLASVLPLTLAMALPFALAFVIELFFASEVPNVFRASGMEPLVLLGKAMLATLPYLMMSVMVAVISRSVALAVGIPLFSSLLIEQILPLLWSRIEPYLPSSLGDALLSNSNVTASVLGLLAYALGFLLIAVLRLRKQDLGG